MVKTGILKLLVFFAVKGKKVHGTLLNHVVRKLSTVSVMDLTNFAMAGGGDVDCISGRC